MVRYDERHRVITTTAAGSAQATGRRQRQAAEGPQRAASAGLQHRPHQRTGGPRAAICVAMVAGCAQPCQGAEPPLVGFPDGGFSTKQGSVGLTNGSAWNVVSAFALTARHR